MTGPGCRAKFGLQNTPASKAPPSGCGTGSHDRAQGPFPLFPLAEGRFGMENALLHVHAPDRACAVTNNFIYKGIAYLYKGIAYIKVLLYKVLLI